MRRAWLVLIALALLLAVTGVLYSLNLLQDYYIFVRARVSALLLLLSVMPAAVGLGMLMYDRALRSRMQAERDANRQRQADEHRQFLLRLDHELKNPLTALQVELANLETGFQVTETPPAILNARGQAQRLGSVVGQLRKLAELDTRPIAQAPVGLAGLLEEIAAEFQEKEQAQENPRKIELALLNVPWSLPDVPGDEDLLYLAIQNVVGNAVKFTRPGDHIQVRAMEDGRNAVVEVADSGPGIPEEELGHVWEELYRGKDARGLPGSGLGLALVRAIMARHGGEAEIRSRVGKGTVVTLRLPLQVVTRSLQVKKDNVTGPT